MLPPMTVARELDDITRNLVRHTHEHPPVRDINQEVDRRTTRRERIAEDLGQMIGSWTFVAFQAVFATKGILVVIDRLEFIVKRPWRNDRHAVREAGGRKSEVGRQRSEVRGRRSDI